MLKRNQTIFEDIFECNILISCLVEQILFCRKCKNNYKYHYNFVNIYYNDIYSYSVDHIDIIYANN